MNSKGLVLLVCLAFVTWVAAQPAGTRKNIECDKYRSKELTNVVSGTNSTVASNVTTEAVGKAANETGATRRLSTMLF